MFLVGNLQTISARLKTAWFRNKEVDRISLLADLREKTCMHAAGCCLYFLLSLRVLQVNSKNALELLEEDEFFFNEEYPTTQGVVIGQIFMYWLTNLY